MKNAYVVGGCKADVFLVLNSLNSMFEGKANVVTSVVAELVQRGLNAVKSVVMGIAK